MKTFREFVDNKDYNSIKLMVCNVLDPQGDTIDVNSDSLLTRPLSEFKNRNKLLSDAGLSDIINHLKNREAVVKAINDDSTTIGNLLGMLNAP